MLPADRELWDEQDMEWILPNPKQLLYLVVRVSATTGTIFRL